MNKVGRIVSTALLIVFIGFLYYVNAFGSVENYYEDLAYQHGHTLPSDLKIIAIDNKTLEELGPFTSWDRSLYADLLDKLYSDGNKPKVVGIDIVFSGVSNSEGDRALTEAVKDRNVVLASKLDVSTRSNVHNMTYEYYISGEETAFDELNNVSLHGFANAILDSDGFLRRAYTSVSSDNVNYDSFAVSVLKAAAESYYDPQSVTQISYTGKPGDFEVISMSDVLDGTIPVSYFDDSIVLVGAYEDGLMDSYPVSVNHKNPMYGVEIQANIIQAFRKGYVLRPFSAWAFLLLLAVFMIGFSVLAYKNKIGATTVILFVFLGIYALLALILYKVNLVTLPIFYVPFGLVLLYLLSVIVRYVESQKQLATEMKQTLFSMADSMAEAIEGRTPYNANHTKNVAKRSVEMLNYINGQYKKGLTNYHFSANDIDQMYLAAMLHDIGKMDVPLEVMDKPTKLGVNEEKLRTRLEIVRLHIKNDVLGGRIDKDTGEKSLKEIDDFLNKLDLYNCGKPLSEEDKAFIESIGNSKYSNADGQTIPYLTEDELDDLSIQAGTLSDKERTVMQSHVVYTNKILSHVHFGQSFDKVCDMASNHHELLNGKGYPNGIGEDKIDIMTRILTIMDIYDSLIADDRPYKKPKTVKVAFEILDEEAEAGKIDKELLGFAKELYLEEEK